MLSLNRCARLGAADQEQEAGDGLDAVEGGDVGHVVELVPYVVLQEANARALPGRLPPAAGVQRGLVNRSAGRRSGPAHRDPLGPGSRAVGLYSMAILTGQVTSRAGNKA